MRLPLNCLSFVFATLLLSEQRPFSNALRFILNALFLALIGANPQKRVAKTIDAGLAESATIDFPGAVAIDALICINPRFNAIFYFFGDGDS